MNKESAILQLKSEITDALNKFRQLYPTVDINIHHNQERIAYYRGGSLVAMYDTISITQTH